MFGVEGRPEPRTSDRPWAARVTASDDFFRTAGIPLVAGRLFSRQDTAGGPDVVLVNQEAARRYFESPPAAIGQRITLGSAEATVRWRTIIGVVGNTSPPDWTRPPNPQIYLPLEQDPVRGLAFMLRAAAADTLAAPVRAAMREIDPALAIYELRTFEQALERETQSGYIITSLYVAFAVIALLLAAAGLYGVIAYTVSQRTQEIGIRIALGAVPRDVQRMVFRQAGRLIVIGAVLGLVASALIAASVRSVLYGVSPFDPWSYGMVLSLLTMVMLAATWLPARRAMHIDPIRALRAE
jgi:putative ABC transport system permease protein